MSSKSLDFNEILSNAMMQFSKVSCIILCTARIASWHVKGVAAKDFSVIMSLSNAFSGFKGEADGGAQIQGAAQSIGNYVIDFICREKLLVIEVDGGQHADNKKDEERDAWLKSEGFKVLNQKMQKLLKNFFNSMNYRDYLEL